MRAISRPEHRLLYEAKKRAKRLGLPFMITATDVIIPTECPALGLVLTPGKGAPGKASPSLDRIVPELGYVPGNVQVISHMANTMKLDATPEQLTQFAKWVLGS